MSDPNKEYIETKKSKSKKDKHSKSKSVKGLVTFGNRSNKG